MTLSEQASPDQPYQVALVDDDPDVRSYISQAIELDPLLQLSSVTDNLADAVTLLKKHPPRVLLVDLGLPDGSGLELIRLASQYPETDSMVISVFEDEYHVISALKMGASGYLLKDSVAETICSNIFHLIQGGSPISPMIARLLLPRFQINQQSATQLKAPLSNRELEVLQLVSLGYTRREISEKLFISVDTVGSHIRHIYKKLAVNSKLEAVRKGTHMGLLQMT